MARQRQLLHVCKSRGSALIATLTMVGVLAIVVAAMLYSVTSGARSTRDKIAYEQAYHAALSGTHLARAWFIDPDLYADHVGGSANAPALKTLQLNAIKMSKDIVESGYAAADKTPSQVAGTWFGGGAGTTLPDGRVVLFEFPENIVKYPNDVATRNFADALFDGDVDGAVSFVEDMRLTTPGTTKETTASLREVTMIIEAKGVSLTGGRRKERVIQEKVLVYPTIESAPLVSAGAAIIGGSALTFKGQSHFNVHWGPVQAKGNIKLLQLTFDAASKTINAGNGSSKFYGAGVQVGEGDGASTVDKWLKWQAGSGSVLTGGDPEANNPTSVFDGLNPPVTDFFGQLVEGAWTSSNLTPITLQMTGGYADAGTNFVNGLDRGLWGVDPDTASIIKGQGAFVQDSPLVTSMVDEFLYETMDYEAMKSYAISHNGYVKPMISKGGGGNGSSAASFVNELNMPLYVTPQGQMTTDAAPGNVRLTSLAQLSMKPLIPADGNTHTNGDNKLDDRILFVDHPNGAENFTGTLPTYDVGSGFFWKGVMYVCGNFAGSGSGQSPSIWSKDPDQFALDPYGKTTGQMLDRVILDGILNVRGNLNVTGNSVIYGTLACTDVRDGAGTPSIFYNTANGQGRLKAPSAKPYDFQLVAGRIFEANKWL